MTDADVYTKRLNALVTKAIEMFDADDTLLVADVAQGIEVVVRTAVAQPAPMLALAVAQMAQALHQGDSSTPV